MNLLIIYNFIVDLMASGFGCMVVGPAGSGKSPLCHALQETAE